MKRLCARLAPLLLATAAALAGLLFLTAIFNPAWGAPTEPGATFVVSNLSDSGAGSLRQAILDANAAPGADVIDISVAGTVSLLSALPAIIDAVTIQGPGPGHFAVDGNDAVRVLDIASVDVTIAGITIQRGNVSGAGANGAGIRSTGNLTLTHVELLSNTAQSQGGGVSVGGNLVLADSHFRNNRSTSGTGGALRSNSAAIISRTTFLANTSWGDGGAIFALGNFAVSDGLFQDNACLAGSCDGGALFSFSRTTLDNTDFLSNTARDQGGGASAPGFLTVRNGRFEGNQAIFGSGGALHVQNLATIDGTHFVSNTAQSRGGGIYGFAALTVTNARFSENESTLAGGGLAAFGEFIVSGTQFLRNRSQAGGGLYHEYATAGRVANSLFGSNEATTGQGAALAIASTGGFEVLHTTIASPAANPGAAIAVMTGTAHITNTIVASHAVAISNSVGIVSQDYNLFWGNVTDVQGAVAGGAHNASGDPLFVAPAGDDYHLGAGSAAVDAGTDAGIVVDYDGETRPLDAGFDIGFDEASYIDGLVFVHAPSSAIAGLPTTFSASVTQGTGISYEWDFGDGTPAVAGNPVSHTFAAAGQYPVTVTASNRTGSAWTTMTVTVVEQPVTSHLLHLPLLAR
jgi:predicted outer membrane repeat protein